MYHTSDGLTADCKPVTSVKIVRFYHGAQIVQHTLKIEAYTVYVKIVGLYCNFIYLHLH